MNDLPVLNYVDTAPAEATERPTSEELRIYPEASGFYIPSLDGIRALAFLIVFIAHAGWSRVIPGGFGVTIFFFLSGYLITTLMRREAERFGRISLRAFYLRRVLRIFPPFYLVLAVTMTAYAVLRPSDFRLSALTAQLAYLTNYYEIWHHGSENGIPPGFGVTWSLSIEEHFYLLFPLIYIALRRLADPRAQAWALLSMCGAILAWRCVLVYGFGVGEYRTYHGSDTRFDSLLFGCVLAIWGNPMLDPVGVPRPRRDGFLAVAGLLAILVSLLARGPGFRETFRYTTQGLALMPLFVAAIRYADVPPFRWLNLRPIRFLGVLSYSLYLVHHVILQVLEAQGLPRYQRAIVGLAISLAIAYAIYLLVERPCARLRRRLSRGG